MSLGRWKANLEDRKTVWTQVGCLDTEKGESQKEWFVPEKASTKVTWVSGSHGKCRFKI